MIRQQRMRVELPFVLSLGSNLGDREATIRSAVAAIAAIPEVTMLRASGLVESAALTLRGVDDTAPAYLNATVAIRTALAPEDLLTALNAIEVENGRMRDERWGDRTLDIDIVAMGALRHSSDRLEIPHPRAADRAFVVIPWLEIEPTAAVPGVGRIDQLTLSDSVQPYPAEPLL